MCFLGIVIKARYIVTKMRTFMEDHEGILLETGTNEVEILELLISGQLFGVNVLKIKQILSYSPDGIAALHAPGIHPAVKGAFLFHGKPILLT
ncbi:MAG: two-component system chemotaxis response regulator CheV, partial [Planctomycetota bacterium]